MKTVSLTSKFYIIFFIIFSIPSSLISLKVSVLIEALPHSSFLQDLLSVGVIQAPTAVSILLLMFWIFNHYSLKFYPTRKILGIPNINGRYLGVLESAYSSNNQKNGTYDVVIEIVQTLTSIKINLYTEMSCSYSLIANLCTNEFGNHELVYVYQNKTSAMNEDADMRNHNGTTFLEIFNEGGKLIGNYFNNPRERGRFGKIEVLREGSTLKGRY